MAHASHAEKTASLRENNSFKNQVEALYHQTLNCMFTESLHVSDLPSDSIQSLNIVAFKEKSL